VIPLGERHLRRTIGEFVAHDHLERNHQGLASELIHRVTRTDVHSPVRRRQRLGGLLSYLGA
jgi:hypothetical protein